MRYEMPSCSDKPLWDLWLGSYVLPCVTAADETGLFDSLAAEPAGASELAARLGLNLRAVEIFLPVLASSGFLALRLGRYHLSDVSRHYLLRSSAFYWGGVLQSGLLKSPTHAALKAALCGAAAAVGERPAAAWASGKLGAAQARGLARFMHSHSLAAALGVAQHGEFGGIRHLMDVGGGSGCFSIALAQRHPTLRCTVMDLAAMCAIVPEYAAAAGVTDRVEARAVDMFREPWPRGADALLFSNIFHDWNLDTCAELAGKAYEALPAGGRIYLHEMLLDDTGAGPASATSFSVVMLFGTEGRQYSGAELRSMLRTAGFGEPQIKLTSTYYSLICARKP
jgi:hypothetical protein